jgi:hypothetical protein
VGRRRSATPAAEQGHVRRAARSTGEPLWIRGFGGLADDYATHVACGAAGVFAGVVTGAATIGALELAPVEQADTVLARLTSSPTGR